MKKPKDIRVSTEIIYAKNHKISELIKIRLKNKVKKIWQMR